MKSPQQATGERIGVKDRVTKGMGSPIKCVLIEIWQANADGRHAHPEGGGPVDEGFRDWGLEISNFENGEWGFDTVKPGPTSGRNIGTRVPHLNVWIVSRGITIGVAGQSVAVAFPEKGALVQRCNRVTRAHGLGSQYQTAFLQSDLACDLEPAHAIEDSLGAELRCDPGVF